MMLKSIDNLTVGLSYSAKYINSLEFHWTPILALAFIC